MEGFHWGWGEGLQGKVQRIRNMIGRHKIDGERLRMVQETTKSKNLYVQPMDMNYGGGGDAEGLGGTGQRGDKWEGKKGKTVIAQSIKYTLEKP